MRRASGRARSRATRYRCGWNCRRTVSPGCGRTTPTSGDTEEALAAAAGVGDDRLQKQARGHVVPDSFTHGSSEQRMRWFSHGLQSGDPGQCDTFKAARL